MAQGETKNLGQISAIWISSQAPDNNQLIWYDTVEGIHKTYQISTGTWIAVNPQIVTNSTIATLRTIAQGDGMSVGKFYYLTDVGTLAIAITTTKIWYVDSHNNYTVNDLASSAQYYVNSSNLLIDGSTGVWEDGQLKFEFTQLSGENVQKENDYLVIRRNIDNVWNWFKISIKNFISAVSGNSISWNGGLYFNFNSALNNKKNVAGGVVSYEQHNNDTSTLANAINTIATNLEANKQQAINHADNLFEAESFFGKEFVDSWSLLDNPPNVPGSGSTLKDILKILLSWVNVLQYSDRIKVGNGFNSNGRNGEVNYTDTVKQAIEKLVFKTNRLVESWLCDIRNYITDGAVLPKGKVYTWGVYPLECRSLRYGSDNLPTLVFGSYRGYDETYSSYPYPDTMYVFIMPDESQDYIYSDTYSWNSAPDSLKELYKQTHKLSSNFNLANYANNVLPQRNDTIEDAIGKLSKFINYLTSDLGNRVWQAGFRNDDWYALVSVGDKIGEFDSSGQSLYTATLEGAVYLLSAWYSETMSKRVSQNTYNAYYTSGRGDGRAEHNDIIKVDAKEYGVRFLHQSVLNFETYQEISDCLYSNSTNYDNVLIIRNLPYSITKRIGDAHGYNTPINLNIPITGYMSSPDQSVCVGTLYAILVQPPSSVVDAYLKFIPYWTYGIHKKVAIEFQYDNNGSTVSPIGLADNVDSVVTNRTGQFGSYMFSNIENSDNIWRSEMFGITIPIFSVVIPC